MQAKAMAAQIRRWAERARRFDPELAREMQASADRLGVRQRKGNALLYETLTAAEYWLAGKSTKPLRRAERRAPQGECYRSILVTFIDGYSVRAGSYLREDKAAKCGAIRYARAVRMEEQIKADQQAAFERARDAMCSNPKLRFEDAYREPHPRVWAHTPDDGMYRTRVAKVPSVQSVEFVTATVQPTEQAA